MILNFEWEAKGVLFSSSSHSSRHTLVQALLLELHNSPLLCSVIFILQVKSEIRKHMNVFPMITKLVKVCQTLKKYISIQAFHIFPYTIMHILVYIPYSYSFIRQIFTKSFAFLNSENTRMDQVNS